MRDKWMITGIGGFVASHLARYIVSKNEEIVGTYRWNEDIHRINDIKNKISMVSADLLDLSSLIRAIADNKPTIISHLAAQSFVNDSFTNPIITVETNTIGTLNLFEAIRIVKDYIDKNYDPIIHIVSSSEVYGKVDLQNLPITEGHPFKPGNQYSIGKIGTDVTAQFYNKYYGYKVIITRMFTHCGVDRTMMSAENSFAKQIAMIENNLQEPIVKHGNLNSIRTWADVRDAVVAYYLLIKTGKTGEIYNIGGDTVKTIQDTLDYLISLSTKKDIIKKELDETLVRKLDVNMQVADFSKFNKIVKWKPKISFNKMCLDLLNFWRKEVKNTYGL